jgi:hypothetical protein
MVFRSRYSPEIPNSSRRPLSLSYPVIDGDISDDRLLIASGAYQHALSKKKKIEALEDAEKLLPIDTLGVIMITHGEEFSENSAFGMLHFLSGWPCA